MPSESLLKNIKLLPIYALFIYTWLTAGVGKVLGPGVPEYFTKMFEATFLATFPGLTVAFYQIAIFELIAALLFIASLFKLEFLADRKRPLLRYGIWFSLVNFAMLGFGMRLISNFDEAGKLFYYFGAVTVISLFVDKEETTH